MRHLFLSLSVSLSSPSKNTQPTPLGHHQPPSTQCHHPQQTHNQSPNRSTMAHQRKISHPATHNNQPPNQSTHTHKPKPPQSTHTHDHKTTQGSRNPPRTQIQFYDPDLIQRPRPDQPTPTTTKPQNNSAVDNLTFFTH